MRRGRWLRWLLSLWIVLCLAGGVLAARSAEDYRAMDARSADCKRDRASVQNAGLRQEDVPDATMISRQRVDCDRPFRLTMDGPHVCLQSALPTGTTDVAGYTAASGDWDTHFAAFHSFVEVDTGAADRRFSSIATEPVKTCYLEWCSGVASSEPVGDIAGYEAAGWLMFGAGGELRCVVVFVRANRVILVELGTAKPGAVVPSDAFLAPLRAIVERVGSGD